MKKKIVAMILTAVALGVVSVGCTGGPVAVIEEEEIVALAEDGESKEVSLKEEQINEEKKSEVKPAAVSEKKEAKSETEEKASANTVALEKSAGKNNQTEVKASANTKTVASNTDKTVATDQKGTNAAQTTQTGKGNVTGTTQVAQTTQGTQTVASTTQNPVAGQKAANNNSVPQTTTQPQTATQPQTTTGQQTGTNTTTTTNTESAPPMPGTPEFEAIKAQMEAQLAAENNQNSSVSSSDNQALLDEINKYREENGLNPLEWSDDLGQQANTRAQEQTDNIVNNGGELDHGYGTEHDGKENLSTRGEGDVLDGWKNSDGHNNTLLDPDAKYAGAATGNVDDGEGNGVTVLIVN